MEDSSCMHIIKTSEQWNSAAVKYKVIPEKVLCIELTPKGRTYIKIGEGDKYYYQLPYISADVDIDLTNYYTKSETNVLLQDKLTIKGELHSASELPMTGNSVGDIYLIKYTDEGGDTYIDEYMYGKNLDWIQLTHFNNNTEISDYATKQWVINYVDSVLDPEHIVFDYNKLILYCDIEESGGSGLIGSINKNI